MTFTFFSFKPTTEESVPLAIRKIRQFQRFKNGWHYGAGEPARANVASLAEELVTEALDLGLTSVDAFPGKDGQITVAIYIKNDDHSFQVQPSGAVVYWQENDPDFDEVEMDFAQAIETIWALSRTPRNTWNSCIISTSGIGIEPKATSEAKLSSLPLTEVAFPSWTMSAFSAGLAVAAFTLATFTLQSPQSRQSSGDLTPQSFQKELK